VKTRNKVPGLAVAESIDALSSDIQTAETQTRNRSFAIAGQEFSQSHKLLNFDPNSEKLRNLMTRLRGDGETDLPRNMTMLLAEYPELDRVNKEELRGLTRSLSKSARSANGLLSMTRVKLSIVRAVIRPLFFEYPLGKFARETGQESVFDEGAARKKSDKLRALEIGSEDFIAWTRTVFELFQDTSVLHESSSREFTGTRMPGVVNSLNIRRYTNVWFNFTAKFQDQILESAQGVQSGERAIAEEAPVSQVRPRYSSFGSPFTYKTLTTPPTTISILIFGVADSSVRATKDWVSKDSFEREVLGWTFGVLEILALSTNEFCLQVNVSTGSTKTGIEIKNRDAETACKDAVKFLNMSLSK
jgi:hypothetical protein